VINVLPDSLGADKSGLDTSMTDNFGGEGAEEGLALISGQTELDKLFSVTHHYEAGAVGGSSDGRSGEGGHGSCSIERKLVSDFSFERFCFCLKVEWFR